MEPAEISIKNLKARFQQPSGLTWGRLQRSDYGIRYAFLPAQGDKKGTVLIAQGFSEFIEKYFELMRDFSEAGYDVLTFDWRGQGKSDHFSDDIPHDLAITQNFDQHVLDMKALVDAQLSDDMPKYLIAHSMGAHISTRFLHDHPDVFNAAVLSAPMMRLKMPHPDWVIKLMLCGVRLFGDELTPAEKKGGWSNKNGPIERDPRSRDPVRRLVQYTYCKDDPDLRLGPPTYQWARHALKSTDKVHKASFYEVIHTPILMGVAKAERIVQNQAIEMAARYMPNAEICALEDARHEIFMERDEIRSVFMRETLSFLEKHR